MPSSDPRFERALATVLKHEGGFVDDPRDPGGATNYGISLRFLKGQGLALGDLDGDGDIDAADVRRMTPAAAAVLYRRAFYEPLRCGEIANEALAAKLFDLGVNMGLAAAVRCLQRALRAVERTDIAEDGRIGPATLAAVNATPPGLLRIAFRSEAAGHYRELVAKNAALQPFLKGWLTRAYA